MKSTRNEFPIDGTDMFSAIVADGCVSGEGTGITRREVNVEARLAMVQEAAPNASSQARVDAYKKVFPGFTRHIPLKLYNGGRDQ